MSTTTTEIAHQAGVSHATVCDVLNDRWRQKRISAKTSQRILQTARALNYRPNRVAQSLLTGRSHTVALIMPAISHSFFPHIVSGVEAEAKKQGYHVLISHVETGLEDEVREIEMLLERRVDGLILAPRHGRHNRKKYRQLLAENIPLVFVNDYFEDVPAVAVAGDDLDGARQAMAHLIGLGHRRIGHLAGTLGPTVTQLRIDGYRQALRDHGLPAPDHYLQGFDYGVAPGYEGMKKLLALAEPPTAVFSANDLTALGGIKAVLEAGLRVPQDVAFVGYGDDLEEVWFQKIPLTTVRIDPAEMGRRAAARLIEALRAAAPEPTVEKLPAQLVVRASCGAIG